MTLYWLSGCFVGSVVLYHQVRAGVGLWGVEGFCGEGMGCMRLLTFFLGYMHIKRSNKHREEMNLPAEDGFWPVKTKTSGFSSFVSFSLSLFFESYSFQCCLFTRIHSLVMVPRFSLTSFDVVISFAPTGVAFHPVSILFHLPRFTMLHADLILCSMNRTAIRKRRII